MANNKRHVPLEKGFTIGFTKQNEIMYSVAKNLTVNEIMNLALVMVRETMNVYIGQKEKEKFPEMEQLKVHLHDTATFMFNGMMNEVFADVLPKNKQGETEMSDVRAEDDSSDESAGDREHVLDEVLEE